MLQFIKEKVENAKVNTSQTETNVLVNFLSFDLLFNLSLPMLSNMGIESNETLNFVLNSLQLALYTTCTSTTDPSFAEQFRSLAHFLINCTLKLTSLTDDDFNRWLLDRSHVSRRYCNIEMKELYVRFFKELQCAPTFSRRKIIEAINVSCIDEQALRLNKVYGMLGGICYNHDTLVKKEHTHTNIAQLQIQIYS